MFEFFKEGDVSGIRIKHNAERSILELAVSAAREDFSVGAGVSFHSDCYVLVSVTFGPFNVFLAVGPLTEKAVKEKYGEEGAPL